MNYFEIIPNEIISFIFSYLHPKEINRVCKEWRYFYSREEMNKFPTYLFYLLNNKINIDKIIDKLRKERNSSYIFETILETKKLNQDVRELISLKAKDLVLVRKYDLNASCVGYFYYKDYTKEGIKVICSASTRYNLPCKNKVKELGNRCFQHKNKKSIFPEDRIYFSLHTDNGWIRFITFDLEPLQNCVFCGRVKTLPSNRYNISKFACSFCQNFFIT